MKDELSFYAGLILSTQYALASDTVVNLALSFSFLALAFYSYSKLVK